MQPPVIHLAYAEDHHAFRTAVVEHLTHNADFVVDIETATGEELLAQLEQAAALPDICILDLRMPPGSGGIMAHAEIKRRWPAMRTVIFSMFQYMHEIIQLINDGVNAYLPKTVMLSELDRALKAIHGGDYYYSTVTPRHLVQAVRARQVVVPNFTEKELQVMHYSCFPYAHKEIADKMGISLKALDGIMQKLFTKLRINKKEALMIFALKNGYVDLDTVDLPEFPNPYRDAQFKF